MRLQHIPSTRRSQLTIYKNCRGNLTLCQFSLTTNTQYGELSSVPAAAENSSQDSTNQLPANLATGSAHRALGH